MPHLHKKILQKNLVKKWKILRGDLVSVMTGKDKGKQGLVKKVLRHKNRMVVEGVHIIKKHVKKSPQNPGSIVKKESTIHYSNVKLVCPETGFFLFKYLEKQQK
jgi:large subunit ribosomal protein L24